MKSHKNLKQYVRQYKRKDRLALSLHTVVCAHHALSTKYDHYWCITF